MPHEPSPDEIRRLILGHLGPGTSIGDLPDHYQLGEAGAGLDSIAVVELVLDCEVRYGVSILDTLLQGEPLTVGALIRSVEAALDSEARTS